eukprot:jgi/Undpi1/10945/HiC_scaffold_3.g01471.m1
MEPLPLLRWGIILALLSSCGTARPALANSHPAFDKLDDTHITDKCWIYTHLNKSGGSTVKAILHRHWGHRFYTYDGPKWQRGSKFVYSVEKEIGHGQIRNVVGGGYAEALRHSSAFDQECQWFTVFRHPISRMVSAYYYCKTSPHDQTCGSIIVNAAHVDLMTFAKHWGNFALRQFSLSFISIDDVMEFSRTDGITAMLPEADNELGETPGWYFVKLYLDDQSRQSNSQPIPDAALYAMLQPVEDLLRDKYSVVGLLEEFNTTLSLFNTALDMPRFDWQEKYLSLGKFMVDKRYEAEKAATLAEAWTNSELKKHMQLDLQLYEHAVDVFHQQVQAYGI